MFFTFNILEDIPHGSVCFTKIVSKVTILTPFPTDVTKYLTTQLKEGCVLALGLRVQFITVGKTWRQEHEVRKQRKDESWFSTSFLLVIQAAIPAHGIMSRTFRTGLPTSVKLYGNAFTEAARGVSSRWL